MLYNFLVYIFLILTNFLGLSKSQELLAEYSSVLLPDTGYDYTPRVHYDGEDSILIFSASQGFPILKYSINSDEMETIGSFPVSCEHGSIQPDSDGNIYCFNGDTNRNALYKYSAIANLSSLVAFLPGNGEGVPTLSLDNPHQQNSTVLMFLGYDIATIELQTYNLTLLSQQLPTSLKSGSLIRVGDRIFAIPYSEFGRNVLELNLTSLELSVVGQNELPEILYSPSLATDGSSVFIIPGFRPNQVPPVSNQGILHFNPETNIASLVYVENWPIKDSDHVYFRYSPSVVYVPKLNRIYGFGGGSVANEGGSLRLHNQIFYMDLNGFSTPQPIRTTTESPVETEGTIGTEPTAITEPTIGPSTTRAPDFFSCNGRPNGFYPHPTNCSVFYGCLDEQLTIYRCPDPYLYDPILQVCNLPHLVECGISCIGREDGIYPHPTDCSLYLICIEEESTVLQCPEPLLFDPIEGRCNFPDQVNCSSKRFFFN